MAHPTYADRILKYLESQRGLVVYAEDMQKEFGLTRLQVMGAINRFIRVKGLNIERVTSGAYRYMPNSTPSGKLFELVGEISDGVIVIKGDDNTIWRAEKLS